MASARYTMSLRARPTTSFLGELKPVEVTFIEDKGYTPTNVCQRQIPLFTVHCMYLFRGVGAILWPVVCVYACTQQHERS